MNVTYSRNSLCSMTGLAVIQLQTFLRAGFSEGAYSGYAYMPSAIVDEDTA